MSDPTLYLYNTEKKKKEPVPVARGETLRMYTCGPTVYDYAHIGNLRTYVFEDILRRTLHFFGYTVFQVMNITDVEDKTIRGALQEGLSLEAYTQKYKEAFLEDIQALNIERVEAYPSAVEHIPYMIEMIEKLLDEGIAYKGKDGSVYFSIRKFPSYGRLSHLRLEELEVGASQRVSADEYDKESASDFVLWKAYVPERDGSIFWESPFGKGRPGWHIECSAMARHLLGDEVDIHCGGVDNIFPHHENEIAQSEACTSRHFVKLWMHAEHLIVDGKKMSKSLGNFYTLRDLFDQGFSGDEIRYLLLSTHYRSPLNFTLEGAYAARHSLKRIADCIERIRSVDAEGAASEAVAALLQSAKKRFASALADDLGISPALAALFDCIRDINSVIDRGSPSRADRDAMLAFFTQCDTVLGCLPVTPQEETVPDAIYEALELRAQARRDKNWPLADKERDYIHAQGYEIEDTPSGSKVRRRR